nr:helix-turn-helix domain-containing protein [Sedimentibacter sp.]
MINITNDNIRYTSFISFLEKGYEGTNIRDICMKVNIKPSSLYFYYKSKQELFFSIYDDIWNDKIININNICNDDLEINISPKMKLYRMYKKTIDFCINNIVYEKFLLRYHLFPSEEISTVLRDRFKFWTNEENIIILNIIDQCIDKNLLDDNRSPNDYLQEYKRFESNQIIDMIISNIKKRPKDLDTLWNKFWNCNMMNMV